MVVDASTTPPSGVEFIVRQCVCEVAGVAPATLGAHTTFASLGLDSRHFVELARRIGKDIGVAPSPAVFYQHTTIGDLATHLTTADARIDPERPLGEVEQDEPIAIIGLACRFPHAANLSAYWRVLVNGEDCTSEIPASRWDAASAHDPTGRAPKSSITRRAALVDDVDLFEPEFFGLSPREATNIDPQQRVMLELSWEVLEHGGIVPASLRGQRVGVFVGGMTTDYGELTWSTTNAINASYGTGSALTLLSNRISYLLGFRGPSVTIDTACASSLTALHLACQSLRRREADLALAGGVILHLRPNGFATMSRLGALSPDGRSKAFGAGADGYGRGEGGGMVLLKRLSDALRDGDVIQCVVRGSAINHNGQSNGLTAPSPHAQAELLREAWARAGAEPAEAAYVEAHGTGTALGDPLEAEALGRVFGPGRSKHEPLLIGSAKTNIGHTEAAAGIAGLIKVVLAMKHRTLPPSLHATELNPLIRFEDWRLRVPTSLVAWPVGRRLAGVSAFGFGGANAHVVLESVAEEPPFVLALAASDEVALDAKVDEVVAGAAYSDPPTDGPARVALVARTPPLAIAALGALRAGQPAEGAARNTATAGSTAFVFAGIGSVWAGMGRHPVAARPAFREVIARCDAITRRQMGVSVTSEMERGPTADRIADPLLHGLLAVVTGMALDAVWRDAGVTPDTVIGHSVGEFAAAVASGALTVEEATGLTCSFMRYNRRLIEADTALASVGLDLMAARQALVGFEDTVGVCVDSAPGHVVIGGDARALDTVCGMLSARGVVVRPLQTRIAPHSPVARRLAEGLGAVLDSVAGRATQVPWISTVTAMIQGAPDAAYWERNVGEPCRFREAIEELARSGSDAYVVVGAHPVVRADIMATLAAAGARGQVFSTLSRGSVDDGELRRTTAALWTLGRASSAAVPAASSGARAQRALALPVSAAVPSSFEKMTAAWQEELANVGANGLEGACGAAGARRAHHRYRCAVVGRSASALAEKMRAATPVAAPASTAGVVFVFSGQGATFARVGAGLYAEEPVFREVIDRCDAVARSVAGWSLVDALLDCDAEDRTARTSVVQPLIFSIQAALAALWGSFGIAPAAVVGQSVGEVAAACVAGALTIEEGMRVVIHRGRQMELAAAGGRTAELTLRARDAEELISGRAGVAIAGINAPGTTLIAGDRDAVAAALVEAEARGVSGRMLRMEYAFHSHHMDALLPRLAESLGDVRSTKPTTQLWSTVTGALVTEAALDAAYWCANVRAPVRLATALEGILAQGHTTLLEVSPHPVLREPLRECLEEWAPGGTALHSLRRDRDDREQMLEAVATLYSLGHEIHWAAVQGRGDPTLAPSYCWDRRRFWIEPTAALAADATGGLLGRRTDSDAHPGTSCWESIISADAPGWLSDHRVRGRVVMPGAGFAEMALTASTGILGGAVELRDLRFLQALTLEEPRLLHVCVSREGRGVRLRFASRRASADDERLVLNATARVVPARAASKASSLAPAVGRSVDATALYERLARGGLMYGPLFRGVAELRQGDGEATGVVTLPDLLPAASAGLHPALLDACLHVPAATLTDDGQTWLPVGIDRIRVHIPGARELIVHTRTELGATEGTARVRAETRDGRLALEIDALRVRRLAAARDLPDLDEWLHEERWPRVALPASDGRLEGTWVVHGVTAANEETSHALAQGLEARGASVIVVPRAAPAEPVLDGVRGVLAVGVLGVPPGLVEVAAADVVEEAVAAYRFADAASAPLVVLTRGARSVDGLAAQFPAGAAAWGIARALAVEAPERFATIIDIDPDLGAAEQASLVVDEIVAGAPDDQVLLRRGERCAGRLLPTPKLPTTPVVCAADGTYLVTGGLGALGLHAAEWLADRGARRLVLVGRSPLPSRARWSALDPATPEAARVRVLRALEARGVSVRVETVDVGDRAAFTEVLARLAEELPPIRGVVHAAGVLHDQMLGSIDRATATRVIAPKVAGAHVLHACLGASLDFFLLYSSAAGTIGSAGQGAYAAANAVLDEIARVRRAGGMAATSVAWGAWAEVGMAANARVLDRLAAVGMGAIPPADGARILDLVSGSDLPHIGVFPVRWSVFHAARTGARRRSFFAEAARAVDLRATPSEARPEGPALDLSDPERRLYNIASWLERCVAKLLGISPERMRRDLSLQSLGLDSLVAVELRNAVHTDLGVKVQLAALSDSTVDSLAKRIDALFGNLDSQPGAAPGATRWSPLVKLSEGEARPVICVHPVGGNVLCYQPLAAGLGRAQPVWAMQAPTAGEAPPDRSIEAMAERYLAAARAGGARPPWVLCGFSFGGAVAYEMALRAAASGEHVAHVLLIDTRVQRRSLLPDEETLLEWCLRDLTSGQGVALGEGATPVARVLAGARRVGLFGPDTTEQAVAPLVEVFRASVKAMVAWQPPPARFPVTLLRAADTPLENIEPWRRACVRGLNEVALDGDHYSLLRAPHVSVVAAQVQACTTAAQDTNPGLEDA